MSCEAASHSAGALPGDVNIHVSRLDQQNINRFARLNARLTDAEDEIKEKRALLENLDDAADETMMLDEDLVPFLVADAFFHLNSDDVSAQLDLKKSKLNEEVAALTATCSKCKEEMAVLKRLLYSKFGDNINLEPGEDD